MKRKEGAFWAVQALILVGVLALVALPSTNPSTSVSQASSSSTLGSNGLSLSLSISATAQRQISVGQNLQVNLSLFNTLPRVNSVPASSDWPFQGVPVEFWPLCYSYIPSEGLSVPVKAVVLKGNYTLQGLQSALTAILGGQCTLWENADQVVFQPSSSQANITGALYQNRTYGPFQLSVNFTTSGYWTLPSNPGGNGLVPFDTVIGPGQYPPEPPQATPFVPGVYTVAVCDEWGQAVVLHFTVNGL
jgi:hypothetical protein